MDYIDPLKEIHASHTVIHYMVGPYPPVDLLTCTRVDWQDISMDFGNLEFRVLSQMEPAYNGLMFQEQSRQSISRLYEQIAGDAEAQHLRLFEDTPVSTVTGRAVGMGVTVEDIHDAIARISDS